MIRKTIEMILLAAAVCLALSGCGKGSVYTAVDGSCGPLTIYPDYKEITVPANIAPLNFHYAMKGIEGEHDFFHRGQIGYHQGH